MINQNRGIHLFNLMGFRVSADWSWLIVAVLMTYTLGSGYYASVFSSGPSIGTFFLGLITTLLLFFSVLLHEIGHSTVARANGIRIIGIRLFIFGGVAEMDREPQSPGIELKVTIAGPAVSAMLAVFFYLLSDSILSAASPAMRGVSELLAQANLIMVLFNMIPGFPMDGGRILRAILWKIKGDYLGATHIASRTGKIVAFGFMGLGAFIMLSGQTLDGVWLAFIGAFLYNAAQSSYLHARYTARQSRPNVGQVRMSGVSPVAVEANLSVQAFIDDFALRLQYATFPVVKAGKIIGYLTVDAVRLVPGNQRQFITLEQLLRTTDNPDIRTYFRFSNGHDRQN